METDVRLFIEEIERNLGVKITVYDERGEYMFGTVRGNAANTDFKILYSDTMTNQSLFRFRYRDKTYIARLDGVGSVYGNYAYLISELSENASYKTQITGKDVFYRSLLTGDVSTYQIEKYSRKYGLPENAPACAMLIVCDDGRAEEVMDVVTAYAPQESDFSVLLDDNQVGFVKFFRDEDTEYRSFNEYAEFLYQSILEETGMHVYITLGAAVSVIGHIHSSFSQALSAYRMKDSVNLSGNVHSFKEYVFTKIIEDLPKSKRNEYLDLLLDSDAEEIFTDKEMIQTAEVFLENNLNVSETSRKLFLHRNTLTYRLDKIERQTGLDIRKFSDAVTFRLITVLYKQGGK